MYFIGYISKLVFEQNYTMPIDNLCNDFCFVTHVDNKDILHFFDRSGLSLEIVILFVSRSLLLHNEYTILFVLSSFYEGVFCKDYGAP